MIKKLKYLINFVWNMKPRYLGFRVYYLILIKTEIIKSRFPINPPLKIFISKGDWINLNIPFFKPITNFNLTEQQKEKLKKKVENIKHGVFTFFGSIEYNLGDNFDWMTNPDTGYKYDISSHWSQINDFSKEAGDIKYVWEKTRFSFLFDLIRYDYHFNEDQSKWVFAEIENFIDNNPINQGPNYKCSQEISLRVLNWTFTLNYYAKSMYLTDALFQKIMNSIYWQLVHVYRNINFSRIAVRNNHAITETAMLYLSYYLFPFMSETREWSVKGKKWLLKEIAYQIYEDGSYLQFSHNYHRVVLQTLTWVLRINQLNALKFDKKIMNLIERSLDFLYQHQDEVTGWLPNYGSNDGALFFPLNQHHYRDYRPQLDALALLFNKQFYQESYEDAFWYGLNRTDQQTINNYKPLLSYKRGGFWGFRDHALTTIRCGKYKDRPSQSDALNLDIWYKGKNILFDPGTYKYNTDTNLIDFYVGSKGHNTLTIGNFSQMVKGGRFIWFYWTKKTSAAIEEFSDRFEFSGTIYGFKELGRNIYHKRKVIKWKNMPRWEIIDQTNYTGKEQVYVRWNLNSDSAKHINLKSFSESNQELLMHREPGWYSECYGIKEEIAQSVIRIKNGFCRTIIEINI